MRVIQSKSPHSSKEFDSDGGWSANDDCSAQYVIDTELLTHTVRATRDIEVGEEITISCTSSPPTHLPTIHFANASRHLPPRTPLNPPTTPPIRLPLHLHLPTLHFPSIRRYPLPHPLAPSPSQRLVRRLRWQPRARGAITPVASRRGVGRVYGSGVWVCGAGV
jgi:hypothetical protein